MTLAPEKRFYLYLFSPSDGPICKYVILINPNQNHILIQKQVKYTE